MAKSNFKCDKMEKTELRRNIKLLTKVLPEGESSKQSLCVVEQLRGVIAQRRPRVVALFSPLPDEVQIAGLVSELSCRVVLPRVAGEDMEFYDFCSASMATGAFGILEPQGGAPCRVEDIDLMVVPGVAFTSGGSRLGRGKGYYDKYLSRKGFRAFCVGVCYAHQLLAELPVEPHDRAMDMVISGCNEQS